MTSYKDNSRKLKMYYWYIDERENHKNKGIVLHGIVTGHVNIADSTFIHTSRVQNTYINKDEHELIVETKNSVYHCPLAYCEFAKQDEREDLVPDYAQIKDTYSGKIKPPVIEAGNVLLVMSNFDSHHFHSLYCKPVGEFEPLSYHVTASSDTFHDNFCVKTNDSRIDLRFFQHFQNIEFSMQETDEMPLYIENIGDIPLYIKTSYGILELLPDQRKLVNRENTRCRDMTMTLPTSSLFSADL
ncbi:MAG: hypothetical protein Q4F11_07560 [Eubacteriales bacterium]|nr:hypothetical protein [Eubacteriales bacterium]